MEIVLYSMKCCLFLSPHIESNILLNEQENTTRAKNERVIDRQFT